MLLRQLYQEMGKALLDTDVQVKLQIPPDKGIEEKYQLHGIRYLSILTTEVEEDGSLTIVVEE